MSTFLYNKIINGPIISRRLGISLGINLLPLENKHCNYNCIYCECGWTPAKRTKLKMFDAEQVVNELEIKLQSLKIENKIPDSITFSGNGEPTLHKEFPKIIYKTLDLRQKYAPKARVAVLTNGTLATKPSIFKALNSIDDCIIKLDGGTEEMIRMIDKPLGTFNLEKYITELQTFKSQLIIQTIFLSGSINGVPFDNSSDSEVDKWLQLLLKIQPRKVMLYALDRESPLKTLQKIPKKKLFAIAQKVEEMGIETVVAE